ncbi:MAG TPA: hypothetical protein VIL20_15285 [Sandaracinaceae bacterium]
MKLLASLAIATLALLPRLAEAQASRLGDPAPPRIEASAEAEAVPPPPSPAALDPERLARLEAWLEALAAHDARDALLSGTLGLVAGALGAAAGTWVWSDDLFGTAPFGRPMVGSLLLAAGGMSLGLGVYSLAATPRSVSRLARYRRAAEAGMTPEALAAFEGELRAEAEVARTERWVSLAVGTGIALAGATIGILSASLDGLQELDRLYGVLVGGAYGVIGIVFAVASLFDSPAETALHEYEAGRSPRASGPTVRFLAGPGALGLAGTF